MPHPFWTIRRDGKLVFTNSAGFEIWKECPEIVQTLSGKSFQFHISSVVVCLYNGEC